MPNNNSTTNTADTPTAVPTEGTPRTAAGTPTRRTMPVPLHLPSNNAAPFDRVAVFKYMALAVIWAVMILLFGFLADYNLDPLGGDYSMFQDIHVMVFIGFGFLMSFLVKNSFTSTGHSLLVAAFGAVWAMMNRWFWHNVIVHPSGSDAAWETLHIGVDQLVDADFAAATVLISFGALIGRLSALQLLVMASLEIAFYNINEAIGYGRFAAADIGGSMIIHTFGAYFGLTVSLVLDRSDERKKKREGKWASTHNSDTMAMMGTLFLWCFWPSFNSYYGGKINDGGVGERAVVNTLLSLCGSVVATFIVSGLLGKGKFSIVDVQNATLAGGVAMGTAANMLCMPYGALIIGSIAGVISTVGYNKLQPALEKSIGLVDTCGVHNLHGLPGIFGAIAGVIVTGMAAPQSYADTGYAWTDIWVSADDKQRTARDLAGYQLATLGMTLGIAIVGGVITAVVLRFLPSLNVFYEDSAEWIVEEEEEGHAPKKLSSSSHPGIEMTVVSLDAKLKEQYQQSRVPTEHHRNGSPHSYRDDSYEGDVHHEYDTNNRSLDADASMSAELSPNGSYQWTKPTAAAGAATGQQQR